MSRFVAAIPARLGSTRLPGKPLADIAGKPMVVHVAERARTSGAAEVWVAADDVSIVDAVQAHGFAAALTRADHGSGTDRLAELARLRGWSDDTIVVNVQGDEPLIDPALIAAVAQCLATHPRAGIATAAHPIRDLTQVFDPNVVKVVLAHDDCALYFSRAPIPYARDEYNAIDARGFRARDEHHATDAHAGAPPAGLPVYRHVGLYAYRCSVLQRLAAWAPVPIERFESLEQLRALHYGEAIAVHVTGHAPAAGVDTPADLARVRALLGST